MQSIRYRFAVNTAELIGIISSFLMCNIGTYTMPPSQALVTLDPVSCFLLLALFHTAAGLFFNYTCRYVVGIAFNILLCI